jgi:ferric-dicitrate binding protein FerR (iron transport regulator)
MSHDGQGRPSDRLRAILREAREDLVPEGRDAEGDFSAVDKKLFARIAEEQARAKAELGEQAAERRRASSSKAVWGGVALLAAAAAALMMIRHQGAPFDAHPLDPVAENNSIHTAASQAASLNGREGAGEIRIRGAAAEPGHTLAESDIVETTDARALFVSDGASRVTWLLEERSRVEVRQAKSPLVLALLVGALEAQVSPVSHGEAFAVDVEGVRVAVHGTHLRVARAESRVTVDLSEGVVAVGPAPRMGSTQGEIVAAPAHVEFDANDLQGTLRVERSAAAVRTPVSLVPRTTPIAALPNGEGPKLDEPALGHRPPPVQPPAPNAHAGANAPAAPTAIVPPAPPVRPEELIAKGVKSCVASQLRVAKVHVTVSTNVTIKVADDGSVQLARFSPPLAPEAQDCASRIIYKTHFAPGAGEIAIPVSVD